MIRKPGPTIHPASEAFWAAARDGVLLVQRCLGCGHAQHYPRVLCARCWNAELEWLRCAGRGRVWTFTIVHRAGHPAWQAETPYVLAIVELEEGPRLLTNVRGIEPESVTVGLAVRAEFTEQDDVSIVLFRPEV